MKHPGKVPIIKEAEPALRERVTLHREKPLRVGCHQCMDLLRPGLANELGLQGLLIEIERRAEQLHERLEDLDAGEGVGRGGGRSLERPRSENCSLKRSLPDPEARTNHTRACARSFEAGLWLAALAASEP